MAVNRHVAATLAVVVLGSFGLTAMAGNPLVPGVGMADPHFHVFSSAPDKVYLYATHDYSPKNTDFRMDNWWVWSSSDLINWTQEDILKPEDTFIKAPYHECWATDGATNGTHWFFYYSYGPDQIGVVVGDTPLGPWQEVLGEPLLKKGLVDTDIRDPGVLVDNDGTAYIVFGTWKYYIAKLNKDMISLAEAPKLIEIHNPQGPYGPGKTDDKPFLHRGDNGIYYLSWGCYYATGKSPYGPFEFYGSVVDKTSTSPDFEAGAHLTMDRHGSFFTFHGQNYYGSNDYSHTGTSAYYRDSVLAYAHYRADGFISPVWIDTLGVGQYDKNAGPIPIANFFKLEGPGAKAQVEPSDTRFAVCGLGTGSALAFPNVHNIPRGNVAMSISISNVGGVAGVIKVFVDGEAGVDCEVPATTQDQGYVTVGCSGTISTNPQPFTAEIRFEVTPATKPTAGPLSFCAESFDFFVPSQSGMPRHLRAVLI